MRVEANETTEQQQPNVPAEDGPEKMSDVPVADTNGEYYSRRPDITGVRRTIFARKYYRVRFDLQLSSDRS